VWVTFLKVPVEGCRPQSMTARKERARLRGGRRALALGRFGGDGRVVGPKVAASRA
jgi:hypothetical protein